MSLFKSKEERRLERTMQARKAVAQIRRQITTSEKHERDYIEKAKRARQMGWPQQYEQLKKLIKKTANIKIRMERQLLAVESALQVKEQAENQHDFATAMNAISKSIAEVFGSTDLMKTQLNFEEAMAQAQTMEERMDTFLEMTSQSVFGESEGGEGELVSDADIDRMIDQEAAADERKVRDPIADDIERIEREIGKLRK